MYYEKIRHEQQRLKNQIIVLKFTWRNDPNENNYSKIKNDKNRKWFKEFLDGLILALNKNAPYNSNLNGIYAKRAFIKIKTFCIYHHPLSRIPSPSNVSITATRTAQSKISNHAILYKSYLLLITVED